MGQCIPHQNLIICSLAHCQPSLKISCKSVRKFLRKVANRQTDKQTDKQRRLQILDGGNNKPIKIKLVPLYCTLTTSNHYRSLL